MPAVLFRAALAAALVSALAATAAIAAEPAMTAETSKGKTLVDPSGKTLYTFDKDAGGKSACTGACEKNWPPLAAKAGDQSAPGWSTIAREDGSKQWAYKGRPLYTFAKDEKAGDVKGDGLLNGAWRVAQP